MDIFVLNIGNTHTQTGIFRNGRISSFSVIPTVKIDASVLLPGLPIAAATVVPDVKQRFPHSVFWVGPEKIHSIRLDFMDSSTLGADRLANAVALAHEAKLPAICVDCGTAITFDVVDSQGIYYGGAIAPGRKLLRKSLHDYTAQLPEVPFLEKIGNAIGKNTIDAILSGTDRGVIELVKGLIHGIGRELGETSCSTWFTGGDADFFLRHISNVIDAGIDFTLKGIGLIYQQSVSDRKSFEIAP